MFIPIKDDNPTKHFPFITIIIIAINVAVFIYQLSFGNRMEGFIINSALIPDGFSLSVKSGLLRGISFADTFIASMFVHGDFLHITGTA